MVGQSDEHLPFIKFPNSTSCERHHDYHNTGFYCERGFILYMLEEKALAFDAHLIEFGLDPLNDDLPDACSIWVKEFYVILPIVHW